MRRTIPLKESPELSAWRARLAATRPDLLMPRVVDASTNPATEQLSLFARDLREGHADTPARPSGTGGNDDPSSACRTSRGGYTPAARGRGMKVLIRCACCESVAKRAQLGYVPIGPTLNNAVAHVPLVDAEQGLVAQFEANA